MAKKIKLSRKKIKQPDEFLTWTELVWEWAQNNIWQTVAVLAVLVLVYFGIRGVSAWYRILASAPRAAIGKAEEALNAPVIAEEDQLQISRMMGEGLSYATEEEKYEDAANQLKSMIETHKGSVEADLAIIYLASSYENLGKYPEAVEYYKQFSATAIAQKDPELMAAGKLGQARSLYAQAKYQDAVSIIEGMPDQPTSVKPEAMLLLARAQFRAGDKEAGKKTLENLKAQYPDSMASKPADFLVAFWPKEFQPKLAMPEGMEESPVDPGGSSVELDVPLELETPATGATAP